MGLCLVFRSIGMILLSLWTLKKPFEQLQQRAYDLIIKRRTSSSSSSLTHAPRYPSKQQKQQGLSQAMDEIISDPKLMDWLIPNDCPIAWQYIIRLCCNPNPSKRPTPEEVNGY